MTVSRDERHHGAQASTDDFNRMGGRLSTDGAKHRSADLVFKEEVLSVRTVLNVAQSFSHRSASLVGNNLWTGDVAAELSVVGDGVVHICQAAFVDQVNDQLHFMAAFEVSHFRSVAGFNQGFEAHLDQFGNTAAQNALFAEQVGFGFFFEGGFNDAGLACAVGSSVDMATSRALPDLSW